ncbi:MAG TPA: UDP-N-acetylmuramate dehydrogenase [Burkholderiales bacterium]|nr:UDP-N-acetylmuramate dehydrogenase [Burkholderiales bacterium]
MNMAEPIEPTTALRGVLRLNEPMAKHVSWRAGGAAARVYSPTDSADLAAFLATLPAREPVCFVGLGSNLLVRDGGFRGTVVLMHNPGGTMRAEGDLIYSEAGTASPKVARFSATHGFEGAEFLAGIPGTVGGALAMNAGCYGSETWDVVARVQTISRAGKLSERGPDEFEIGYRHTALRRARLGEDEWFVAAWFRFRAGDQKVARKRIKDLLAMRLATQPLELPNAGSVFRNPPGDHAARLIEAAGLKGRDIGGARISEKHANFIVNPKGRARASDIEALIKLARDTVMSRFGIELVPEIRIVGEPA